jgi:hypothetical protein
LGNKEEVSKETVRTATKLLKLLPYKTTVVPSLQLHDPVARFNSSNWSLLSVHDDELASELTLLSSEAGFINVMCRSS